MKRITCRVHGGTFLVEPKRGRPPVKCSEDNPCKPVVAYTLGAKKRAPNADLQRERDEASWRGTHGEPLPKALQVPVKAPESPAEPATPPEGSIARAHVAKALLEAQGWACHASIDGTSIQFHASRDTERIAMIITDGVVVSQEYTLWDTQKPSTNEVPAGMVKLPFNPDEMTDSELVRALMERTVIWWNRIAKGEEKATLPTKVSVTHTFNGHEDEVPADRVITFVDMHGGGFRTFRQGALMRLDK